MTTSEGRKRVVIEGVSPEIDCGRHAAQRVVGEELVVRADVISDGHDLLAVRLRYRNGKDAEWQETPMKPIGNDRWEAAFTPLDPGRYYYTVQAWVDTFGTWQKELEKKYEAGLDVEVDLMMGLGHIEQAELEARGEDKVWLQSVVSSVQREGEAGLKVALCLNTETTRIVSLHADRSLAAHHYELPLTVSRKKALFSSWYELFPRSWGKEPGKHGTFRDCQDLLPEIARMGFDVLYLPPIHPIGKTNRKGKNNSTRSGPDDPGCPWAIGDIEGGHKAVHPDLGTLEDFRRFVGKANGLGIEVALDLAFQCSPDHPYVKEHPEWFLWRPDGTVQYAENPPKKYEDIVPFYFETARWRELWAELKSVVDFWRQQGIRIFRVDNPHTKALPFWEWLIEQVLLEDPEVIFLAEAFTRPRVMYRLAKLGFTQSYTYFTWRTTKEELAGYVTELTRTHVREFFRPNFWPNTPDILTEFLQVGGRPAFIIRLVLAATLSSNYGIYGPTFELCVGKVFPGKEEYLDGEKYELRHWDWDAPGNLKDLIATVNAIRRDCPALQTTWNVEFYHTDNDSIMFYGKFSNDRSNAVFCLVNLDPFQTQAGTIQVPVDHLGIPAGSPYLVHDLLNDEKWIWLGGANRVELDPRDKPARIFRILPRLRRESDFDYFM